MAEQVKFDYSLTAGVISEDEMKAMEKITKDAKDVLVAQVMISLDGSTFRLITIRRSLQEFRRQHRRSSLIQRYFL